MHFALGPSMVMRQSTVDKIGGFGQVAQYYADDFVLGKWTATAGETVVLSTYIVEHHVRSADFKKCIAHQQGWATSTRFSRPLGHLGEILTYAVPYGLLALAAFAAAGHLALGLALLAITLLDRVLLCLLVAGCVVGDRAALRKAWLYPLRDFMGFCFWLRSYIGTRHLRYRGDPYELLPKGRLRKLAE
jgi:ceramide glucosyltransferase